MTDLRHRLRVHSVIPETHDSASVVFRLAPNQRESFNYRPGQFLTLRIPTPDGTSVTRCYSLASSPGVDEDLKVTVKRVDGGIGSNWLCDLSDQEVEIESLAPTGVFVPRNFDHDHLLVAGGSGITPVMSIAKSVLHDGTGRVVVLYANRDPQSIIFREEFTELVDRFPDRMSVVHWIETVQGLPTAERLGALLDSLKFEDVFVCGPTPFMAGIRTALKARDFPRESLHIERFNSLEGDPFSELERAPEPDHNDSLRSIHDSEDQKATNSAPDDSDVESVIAPTTETATEIAVEIDSAAKTSEESTPSIQSVDATLIVDFDGDEHTLPWPAGTLLLDVLKKAGLKVPSSCAEGVCAACECHKTEGEVHMHKNLALEEDDLEEGYILACQSVALTPNVRIKYEEI